jgi:hypothetical protein
MVEVIVQQVDCFSHAEKIGFVGSGIGASQPTGCTLRAVDANRYSHGKGVWPYALTVGMRIVFADSRGTLIRFCFKKKSQTKKTNIFDLKIAVLDG